MRMPIEDRIEIQELTAKYAHHCDSRQLDELLALFTDDAIMDETELGLPRAEGKTALTDYFRDGSAPLSHMMHLLGNHLITGYDGDTASGQCSFLAVARVAADGGRIELYGYYRDEYVRRDGRWLFRSRYVVAMMPPDLAGMLG